MRYHTLLLAVAVILLSAGTAPAQITITAQDFPVVGTSSTERSTEYAVDLNLGPAGPDCTWTVTGYPMGAGSETQILLPSATPFGGSFPTATHAMYRAGQFDISYDYLRVAADGIWELGRVEIPFEEDPVIIVYEQESRIYALPLTYGSTWTAIRNFTVSFGPDSGIVTHDSIFNVVDGWGTLDLDSVSLPVLRVRGHRFSIRTLPGQAPDTSEDYVYDWISNADVQGVYMYPAQSGPDSVFTLGYVGIRLRNPTAANVRGPVAESFMLAQNYPNPFNASTTLPLELERHARVSLTIYDETGRVVRSDALELPVGRHEVRINGDHWASGIYFARVVAKDRAQTMKMMLIR